MIFWPIDARPHIVATHIDGPMLCMRTGEVHWLTLRERIQFAFGWTDALKLERKHSQLLRSARASVTESEAVK